MAPKFVELKAGTMAAGSLIGQLRAGLTGVAPASGPGVLGVGKDGDGVEGLSDSGAGVSGYSNTGPGVWASSDKDRSIYAENHGNVAVWAQSATFEAVHAETHSPATAAIAAYNLNPNGTGAAIYAKKAGVVGQAGFFDGNVWVNGEIGVAKDIKLANGDCAEEFDVAEPDAAEPGTVMIAGDGGVLRVSRQAYDSRVAGVISGGGSFRPAIVLDNHGSQQGRRAIALVGKVFCKVDATYASIGVGDLLTTSDTAGHAMKACDARHAFGAVIGKALATLQTGRGLIPILIALQ
jgi:hypothetical protein